MQSADEEFDPFGHLVPSFHGVSLVVLRLRPNTESMELEFLSMLPKITAPSDDEGVIASDVLNRVPPDLDWQLPEIALSGGESFEDCAFGTTSEILDSKVARPRYVETLPRKGIRSGAISVCVTCVGRRVGHIGHWKGALLSWMGVDELPVRLDNYPTAIASAIEAVSRRPALAAQLIGDEPITISELRSVLDELHWHAMILNKTLARRKDDPEKEDSEAEKKQRDIRNFRRQMEKVDWLKPTGKVSRGDAHRPAMLYEVKRPDER